MQTEFDKCVEKVIAQGKDKDIAINIVTAAFNKVGKPINENINKEKKIDEDGNIIISENTKIYLDADISVVEE